MAQRSVRVRAAESGAPEMRSGGTAQAVVRVRGSDGQAVSRAGKSGSELW